VMQHGDKIVLPSRMEFENVEVVGREKGVRLMSLSNQWGYMVDKPGGYDNGELRTNVTINFDNIQLENMSNIEGEHHFVMHSPKGSRNEHALYPSVTFTNCTGISIKQGGIAGNFYFEKCSI